MRFCSASSYDSIVLLCSASPRSIFLGKSKFLRGSTWISSAHRTRIHTLIPFLRILQFLYSFQDENLDKRKAPLDANYRINSCWRMSWYSYFYARCIFRSRTKQWNAIDDSRDLCCKSRYRSHLYSYNLLDCSQAKKSRGNGCVWLLSEIQSIQNTITTYAMCIWISDSLPWNLDPGL